MFGYCQGRSRVWEDQRRKISQQPWRKQTDEMNFSLPQSLSAQAVSGFFPWVCVWAPEQRTSSGALLYRRPKTLPCSSASGGAGPLPVALPHISCWEVKSRAAQSQGGSCSLFSFPLVDKTMPSLPEFHLIAALYMCDYLALGMFSGWDRSQGSA